MEQLFWNLSIKKGYSLIEVMCSITIFSTLFITVLSIQINNLKIKSINNEIYNYSVFLEAAKNNIMYNCSYDEIQKLDFEKKYYISKENLQIDKIKDKGIQNLFVTEKPLDGAYLVINIEEGKVMKLNLKLYEKIRKGTKVIECEFYKGKYHRTKN
ncbi:prepilin-type N-terminal cleavage/methylation domain-containing protein [Clostridium thailandense]|uniref:prepilin-type N-terminal cleavage/methylation domain-containing protein n=1 Tax=Clostridium thailandense TaxID=2794346 RepID=UPI0039892357